MADDDMYQNWRISSFNGALLACYFIPAWTIVAFKIMVSPIRGLYEQPNIAFGLFMSDYMQVGALSAVRIAWLLALAKLTVVAFFAVFLVLTTRASIRRSGGCDEALTMALAIGGLISFVSMILASQVNEPGALRLHATELLLLLGNIVLLAIEPPLFKQTAPEASRSWQESATYPFSSPNS